MSKKALKSLCVVLRSVKIFSIEVHEKGISDIRSSVQNIFIVLPQLCCLQFFPGSKQNKLFSQGLVSSWLIAREICPTHAWLISYDPNKYFIRAITMFSIWIVDAASFCSLTYLITRCWLLSCFGSRAGNMGKNNVSIDSRLIRYWLGPKNIFALTFIKVRAKTVSVHELKKKWKIQESYSKFLKNKKNNI